MITQKNIHYIDLNDRDMQWGMAVNTVGYESYPPGMEYPTRNHPSSHYYTPVQGRVLQDYGIIYVTEGEGMFESAHQPLVKIPAGSVMILFPGEWHNYYPNIETEWSHMWICFRGENMDKRIENGFLTPEKPILNIGVHDDIIQLYLDAVRAAEHKPANYQIMLAGIVNHLLGVVCTSFTRMSEHKPSWHPDKMNEARILMIENLHSPLTIQEIADRLGMSYSSFRQCFKKYFNESPASYFQMLKIQRAIDMLRNTHLSIKEIAISLNFNSWDNFCTAFKQKTGKRPSDYRN